MSQKDNIVTFIKHISTLNLVSHSFDLSEKQKSSIEKIFDFVNKNKWSESEYQVIAFEIIRNSAYYLTYLLSSTNHWESIKSHIPNNSSQLKNISLSLRQLDILKNPSLYFNSTKDFLEKTFKSDVDAHNYESAALVLNCAMFNDINSSSLNIPKKDMDFLMVWISNNLITKNEKYSFNTFPINSYMSLFNTPEKINYFKNILKREVDEAIKNYYHIEDNLVNNIFKDFEVLTSKSILKENISKNKITEVKKRKI